MVKKIIFVLSIALLLLGIIPARAGEIHDAARKGDLAKVKALVAKNPKLVNERDHQFGDTPLHDAVIGNYKDIAVFLLSKGADVNSKDDNGATSLHKAALNNRTEMVVFLIKKGAGVKFRDMEGETPLHWAAAAGKTGPAEILLKNGVDVNSKDNNGNTPLKLAMKNKHKNMVELLKKHGGKE